MNRPIESGGRACSILKLVIGMAVFLLVARLFRKKRKLEAPADDQS